MKKIRGTLFLFSIVLMVPCIILFSNFFGYFKYSAIISNGIETEAIVLNMEYANMEIKEEPIYIITYQFYDEQGEMHFGKTQPSFTGKEAMEFINNGYITIKYNPETFESVEASYTFFSGGKNIIFIFFLVFTTVDLIIWGVLIYSIIKSKKNKRIEKDGKEYTATFISYDSNVTVNNVPMFHIIYTWENEYGEIKQEKTSSDYTLSEAMMFKHAKTFKIKAIGNEGVIVSVPTELTGQIELNKLLEIQNKCQFCGGLYDKQLERCPSCGAVRNK